MAEPLVFDPSRPWRLHPQVALREEAFGALAYHYGNRRLVFLRSVRLVHLVEALDQFPSARDAIEATGGSGGEEQLVRALAQLAAAEVIGVR